MSLDIGLVNFITKEITIVEIIHPWNKSLFILQMTQSSLVLEVVNWPCYTVPWWTLRGELEPITRQVDSAQPITAQLVCKPSWLVYCTGGKALHHLRLSLQVKMFVCLSVTTLSHLTHCKFPPLTFRSLHWSMRPCDPIDQWEGWPPN